MASKLSSISQALANNADALQRSKPDGMFAARANSGGFAGLKGSHTGLPTPPNSISPVLPDAFRANVKDVSGSPPYNIDSDIDLQDAGEADSKPAGQGKSEDDDDFSNVGNITPAMLAKYHLADLVLDKGPIAIRHLMNHLSATVPGFSQIAPPKARRLTVAALESKVGGGIDGNIEFEKVGWGRWDARVKGQPGRDKKLHSISEDRNTPPTAGHRSAGALQIPGAGRSRPRQRRPSHGSWTADSMISRSGYTDHDDLDVTEHDADAMSIDMDEEGSHNLYRPNHNYTQMDSSSDTDEEDWSTMGADALRDGLGTSGPGRPIHFTTSLGSSSRSRSRGWSPYPRSLPTAGFAHHQNNNRRRSDASHFDFSGTNMDSQEQDAIAALINMGTH